MRVSIVTVCFNAEKTIKKAIESVLSQKYDDFEYIVIDGKSTDRTYDIVLEYEVSFREKNIGFTHLSEEDKGIYDAMNKAVAIANGKWICFINADDMLYDENVLVNIFSNYDDSDDVIYGDVYRIGEKESYIDMASPIKNITLTMPFCHQSSFTKKELIVFDSNHIVADYKLFLGLYLDGKKFRKVDMVIAGYSTEGFSNIDKYKTYLDVVSVKDEFGLINKNSLKQRIKNSYYRQVLDENRIGHGLAKKLNAFMTEKRK